MSTQLMLVAASFLVAGLAMILGGLVFRAMNFAKIGTVNMMLAVTLVICMAFLVWVWPMLLTLWDRALSLLP
jgi:Ca2+/H+ antiporter